VTNQIQINKTMITRRNNYLLTYLLAYLLTTAQNFISFCIFALLIFNDRNTN